MEFTPHSEKQDRALFSPRRIVAALTGIQWGKTWVGGLGLKMLIHKHTEKDDAFIIAAPNYKIMKQSSLPHFLRIMDGCGEYNRQEEKFVVDNGGTVYFRTGTDPDSVVGITNVRGIWGDEAGLFGLYFWENLQARAAFREAPIYLTSSPYALNWVYKEIILPKIRDKTARPDVELVQARSDENPFFPKEEYERRKATMDPRRFNMMFGGQWEKMEGLVYDCFDMETNTCQQVSLPSGTKFYAGVDWGHTHPFVMVIRAITPTGMHYQVGEFYKPGLTIKDMIEAAGQKKIVWGIEKFFCGPDRPENIVEFNRAGLPAVPAKNDVVLGIDHHYELIKARKYKVFEGTSPYTLDEYEKYHWPAPEELDPNKDDKERNPVKQDDDCMDANRYLTIMTYRRQEVRRAPQQPKEKPAMTLREMAQQEKRIPKSPRY